MPNPTTPLNPQPSRHALRLGRGLLATLVPLALAAALVAAPPAPQANPDQGASVFRTVHGSIPTPGPVSLRVAAEIGNVQLTGGPAGVLTYTVRLRARPSPGARANLDAWPISVRRQGDEIIIATGRGPASGHTHIAISVTVPPQVQSVDLHSAVGNLAADGLAASVHAQTAAGDIAVNDVHGAVRVQTAGGTITLGHLGGSVHAATAGGNISLGSAPGAIQLQSQGGNISIGQAGGDVHVATAGGAISIHSAAASVEAETGGGNIELGQIAGPVHAISGGGNIRVAAAPRVRCQTGGGDIQLSAVSGPVRASTGAGSIHAAITSSPAQFAASQLESGFGAITVYLPPRLPVTVEATGSPRPGSAGMTSDFPQITAAAASGNVIDVRLNGGGPVLQIQTSNGGIHILKATPR